jgi:pimeloyl-ACP methyl ester carboxylesterase
MPQSIWTALLGAEVKFVQGKKYRTRIVEAGEENPETLVMAHGGGGHLETFAYNVMPLAQHFHVIGMEMVCHGFSTVPDVVDDFNALVSDQVLDVMDALALDKVWLHGEAGGGSGITPLVMTHPERLKGVIFESGIAVNLKKGTYAPPLPPVGGMTMGERTIQLLDNPTWEGIRARLLMVMHNQHPERVTDELVDIRLAHYSRPSTNDGQRKYYTRQNSVGYNYSEEEIAKINLPVLVLWCDGNSGLGPDAGERVASIIPGAQFKLMPETGWWAHWEKPELFNSAVTQFIHGDRVT